MTLVVVGKLKEKYWAEAEKEYLKRLSAFVKLEIVELREESFTEKDQPEVIKQKEAKKIINELEKNKPNYLIAMSHTGKQFSSQEFSKQLIQLEQYNNITITIGGPLGLHESIIKKANLTISLSPLTFTHQMARVILEEQLYRAFMIKENRKYHY